MMPKVGFAQTDAHAANPVIRIGIFQNAPMVFSDDLGEPSGIYVDILNEVARLEGWKLDFIPGSFAEGLQAVSALTVSTDKRLML